MANVVYDGRVETAWLDEKIAEGRTAKAAMLAATLARLHFTAEDVARFTTEDRRDAEHAAGTRQGSDATWRIVAEMLAGSGRRRARCPFCHRGDPAGMPGPAKAFGHDGPCASAPLPGGD